MFLKELRIGKKIFGEKKKNIYKFLWNFIERKLLVNAYSIVFLRILCFQ